MEEDEEVSKIYNGNNINSDWDDGDDDDNEDDVSGDNSHNNDDSYVSGCDVMEVMRSTTILIIIMM